MEYKNLATMFFSKRSNYSTYTAYKHKKEGQWQSVSFGQAISHTEKIAAGFASLGIEKGNKIAIISENRLEWALSDYATLCLGAILVPIYPTLLKDQVKYILNDSGSKVVIVSDENQMEKVNDVVKELDSVEYFFIMDSTDNSRWQSLDSLIIKGEQFLEHNSDYVTNSIETIKAEHDATIIYTSGTTGEPKGVVLTHKNILSNIESVAQIFDCYPEDTTLSFLPLSHILERMAGHYFASYHAATIAYAESIEKIADNMREVKPTLMVSVPRLYEKMYSRIVDTIESGSMLKRIMFYWALNVGREYIRKIMNNQKIPFLLNRKKNIADKLVFRKLKHRVGGKLRFFISGGAPLSAEIGEFFAAAGLIILEGYGLTETSPAISFNRPDSFKFGTVGLPIPGVEVKIAEDGEILTRGDHVMSGYFNKQAETKEVIDEDGWFYTGDIGVFDSNGFLIITDRKKNIIVTSGGKNVAPQPIENNLITSQYIEQAVVIGDNRRFCSVLIVPAREAVINWASTVNLKYENYSELITFQKFYNLIQSEIDKLTKDFARFEQVKKFCIIERPFDLEHGELTPTLKIKRKVIEKNYAAEINRMYQI